MQKFKTTPAPLGDFAHWFYAMRVCFVFVVLGLRSGVLGDDQAAKPGHANEAGVRDAAPNAEGKPAVTATASDDMTDSLVGVVRAIEFRGVSGQGVTVDELQSIEVLLAKTESGYAAAAGDQAGEKISVRKIGEVDGEQAGRKLLASGVNQILQAVSKAYQQRKIAAVKVFVTRESLQRVQKAGGDGVLVIDVIEATIGKIKIRAVGPAEKKCPDDPLCKYVVERSPVKPGQMIHLDQVEKYVDRLNRQAGRQVDIAVVPSEDPNQVDLEYVVAEGRQPIVYAQIDNTGTAKTSRCREYFGFIYDNFTRSDDVLSLGYVTGNFEDVNAATWSYDRPLDPDHLLRSRFYGSWRTYTASDVGDFNQEYSGDSYKFADELSLNIYQRGSFFVDALAGIEYQRVGVDNGGAGTQARTSFLTPFAGFRAEQKNEKKNFHAEITAQFNLPDCANTADEGVTKLDVLGRSSTDRNWTSLHYEIGQSMFLEPLLDKDWDKPGHHSTLAHEVYGLLRGQVALDDSRVPANYMYTAGGFYTVRGYPESFISGDNAVIGTAEYCYHWPRGLKPDRNPPTVLGRRFRVRPEYPLGMADWDLIFRGFFDAGWVGKNNKQNYTIYERTQSEGGISYKAKSISESDMTLVGAGVGVELALKNNIRLRTDFGFPLKSANNGEDEASAGDCRVHVSMALIY